MQIYVSKSLTKLGMKLKLVSLEIGSPPLSNDAISVSVQCIVWKINAFKTTPLKIATFQPDENELIRKKYKISTRLSYTLLLFLLSRMF
jgi:hypothetical protein